MRLKVAWIIIWNEFRNFSSSVYKNGWTKILFLQHNRRICFADTLCRDERNHGNLSTRDKFLIFFIRESTSATDRCCPRRRRFSGSAETLRLLHNLQKKKKTLIYWTNWNNGHSGDTVREFKSNRNKMLPSCELYFLKENEICEFKLKNLKSIPGIFSHFWPRNADPHCSSIWIALFTPI